MRTTASFPLPDLTSTPNTMSRSALRDQIFNAQDIKKEIVHSTAWDCDVEVRGMSGTARASVMAVGYDDEGRVDYAAFYPAVIIATAYVPGTEEALFDAADRDLLNTKSASALEELALPAMKLSGLSKDDLKGAEKNSVPAPISESGST
jgi:hypothetical protein